MGLRGLEILGCLQEGNLKVEVSVYPLVPKDELWGRRLAKKKLWLNGALARAQWKKECMTSGRRDRKLRTRGML